MTDALMTPDTIRGIAERTLIVTLTTSCWQATRLHAKETAKLRRHHQNNAARVLTRICEHEALAKIHAIDTATYNGHRALTSPTAQDGMRMVPAARHMEHANFINTQQQERDALVKWFLRDYPQERLNAPVRLNGLYDASMWPSEREIATKFAMNVRYLACPSEGAWGEWLVESARAASDELVLRLREALERVRDNCSGDGRLFETVFTNLGELLTLVPDLNLTMAPAIQRVAEAAAPLASQSAVTLRDDKAQRKAVGKQAQSILTLLGGIK